MKPFTLEAAPMRIDSIVFRAAIAILVAVSTLLVSAATAWAGKSTDDVWPSAGTGSGADQLRGNAGIAVHESSGYAYVLDAGNNRVVRFAPNGDFERTWGGGVVVSGPGDVPTNEVQQVGIRATGGTYTLTLPGNGRPGFDERQVITVVATGGTFRLRSGVSPNPLSDLIPFDASAGVLQAALEALPQIGTGNVMVTGAAGGPWTVQYTGVLAETDVPQLSSGGTVNLTGSPKSVSIATPGETTGPIAHDGSAATVEAALESLGSLEPADVSVSGPDANVGVLDRIYKVTFDGVLADWDVSQLSLSPSGLVEVPLAGEGSVRSGVSTLVDGASAAEICVPANGDICKAGVRGGAGGQFGSGLAASGIVVDQAGGTVYVGDSSSGFGRAARVQKFDLLGAFQRAWGRNVVRTGGAGDVPVPERQLVRYDPAREPPAGGTFTLYFAGETTGPISHDAPPAGPGSLQAALEALSAIDPGDISVTGSPGAWQVVFSGAYSDVDPPQMTDDDDDLVGTFTGIVTGTPIPYGAAPEICTSAVECLAGTKAAQSSVDSARGGEFGAKIHPAVGSGGTVFVLDGDASSNRVQRFDSNGVFQRAWGEDVIQAGKPGDLGESPAPEVPGPFEVCVVAGDCKEGGGFGGAPGLMSNGSAIAVDAANRVFVVDADPDHVHRFDADGSNRQYFADSALGVASLPAGQDLAGIAVDLAGGFFVSTVVGGERLIREVDASGAFVEDHAVGAGLPAPTGLAYRSSTGELYVSVSSSSLSNIVVLDDDGGVVGPGVTIDPATDIAPNSATLHGAVDPNGLETTYSFELSSDGGATWTTVPSQPLLEPDGPDPQPVEATATGLQAGASYLVRIRAQSVLVGTSVSAEEPFVTASVLPDAITFPANQIADTSAVLRGEVNPNNLPTAYRFEYGETGAYGSAVPVPDGELATGGVPVPVARVVEGLAPDTEYHFRIVATNAEGTSHGEDRTFRTLPVLNDEEPRVAEMASPPFKVTRAVTQPAGGLGTSANPALVSLDGERLLWNVSYFPLTEEQEFPFTGDRILLSRDATPRWQAQSLVTLPPLPGASGLKKGAIWTANSGDFLTQAWFFGTPILANAGTAPQQYYTRRAGTGTSGFTGWLENVDTQHFGDPYAIGEPHDGALLNDEGSAMARYGPYRGLAEEPDLPGDEDPSDEQQLPGRAGGWTLYRQLDPPHGEKDLVAECTGTVGVGDATELPSRVGSGAATDTIGARSCEEGAVTSPRGAVLGTDTESKHALEGPAATAMSNDGRRIFFTSPDPGAMGAPVSCGPGTEGATDCPPQLYVRQYDADGENAVVRWISRSRSAPLGDGRYGGPMIAGQQIGQMGAGVGFLGASRSGDIVYFKTNAPLTPDDPNGGDSITSGSASNLSWDVYRYELPASGDPGDGALTRISGGPAGGDPGVARATAGPDTGPGYGAPARFISDDGKRVYLVTTAPIPGVDSTPPLGGSTDPGGSPGNATTRNLYLFDATAEGADRYRFVARLPAEDGDGGLNLCASLHPATDAPVEGAGISGKIVLRASDGSCFRATPASEMAAFMTLGQLADDDTDAVADIYAYDARSDELVRVTRPVEPGDAGDNGFEPGSQSNVTVGNGDLGHVTAWAPLNGLDKNRGWGGGRTYNFAVDEYGRVSLFFESRIELVPEDTNGTAWDTYEWREGRLSLISAGDTDDHAYYSGNSIDGEDVFVMTSERISPIEIDDSDYDIYDYRKGGGIPFTPPTPPCQVLALRCEVAASAPPSPAPLSTAGFRGSGNVRPPRRCGRGKVRRHGRCVTKKRRGAAKRGKAANRPGGRAR